LIAIVIPFKSRFGQSRCGAANATAARFHYTEFMRTIAILILFTSAIFCGTNGGVSVPTANTAVRLSSTSLKCSALAVQAAPANTGKICVGLTGAVTCTNSATPAATDGVLLNAGDSYAFMPSGSTFSYDLLNTWVVGTVNTQGVTYTCQ
jgi:hypothetical protein